jgi:hypothetical protein
MMMCLQTAKIKTYLEKEGYRVLAAHHARMRKNP